MSQKRRSAADEPFLLVRSAAIDLTVGRRIAGHSHGWHQLVFAASGLLAVETEHGTWLAPPSWAVWVPAGAPHSLRFVGQGRLRTLYLRPDGDPRLPEECCALAVSPLLRELVLRAVELGMLDARAAEESAVAALIRAELGRSGPPPFTLPQPASVAIRQAARILSNDGEAARLPAVARTVGLGVRTLERRFQAETGLTPGRWRRQQRLLSSLELLAGGGTVTVAAIAAGFGSTSAFIAAFRLLFGTTPARYFSPVDA